MFTEREKQVISFLDGLVYDRFNIDTLNKKLSEYFGHEVRAEFVENECADWNILFDIDNGDVFGYFDLYVLKMKHAGLDGSTFMVTEVGYQFE